jgi:hypothetical protein
MAGCECNQRAEPDANILSAPAGRMKMHCKHLVLAMRVLDRGSYLDLDLVRVIQMCDYQELSSRACRCQGW